MNSTKHMPLFFWVLALLGGAVAHAANNANGPSAEQVRATLPVFQTPYYVVHCDLDPDETREAITRMTKMFEEYRERTKGFSGQIRQKFPFYLFKSREEYTAAGGPPNTGGVFMSWDGVLMGFKPGTESHAVAWMWHTVQHEGFHQFVSAVIGGNMPPWLNEGMAEYFGEGIFTGDSYITGAIPPERLRRLKFEMEQQGDKGLPTIKEMLQINGKAWASNVNIRNYDKAWSMVHFLVNGESGKYQKLLVNVMLDLNRGAGWDQAWVHSFGTGGGFEDHWKTYWTDMDANPTDDVYARATVATLTSFLARAAAQRQHFMQFEDFATAAAADQVKIAEADWLPPMLLKLAMADAARRRDKSAGQFALDGPATGPNKVVLTMPDGTRLVGTFALTGGHPADVKVQTITPATTRPTTTPPTTRHAN